MSKPFQIFTAKDFKTVFSPPMGDDRYGSWFSREDVPTPWRTKTND